MPTIFVSQDSSQTSSYSPCPKTCSLGISSLAGSQFLGRSEQRPCWLGQPEELTVQDTVEGPGCLPKESALRPHPQSRAGRGGSLPPSAALPSVPSPLGLVLPHAGTAPQLGHRRHEPQTCQSQSFLSLQPLQQCLPHSRCSVKINCLNEGAEQISEGQTGLWASCPTPSAAPSPRTRALPTTSLSLSCSRHASGSQLSTLSSQNPSDLASRPPQAVPPDPAKAISCYSSPHPEGY